jgi:hypothetical protein
MVWNRVSNSYRQHARRGPAVDLWWNFHRRRSFFGGEGVCLSRAQALEQRREQGRRTEKHEPPSRPRRPPCPPAHKTSSALFDTDSPRGGGASGPVSAPRAARRFPRTRSRWRPDPGSTPPAGQRRTARRTA